MGIRWSGNQRVLEALQAQNPFGYPPPTRVAITDDVGYVAGRELAPITTWDVLIPQGGLLTSFFYMRNPAVNNKNLRFVWFFGMTPTSSFLLEEFDIIILPDVPSASFPGKIAAGTARVRQDTGATIVTEFGQATAANQVAGSTSVQTLVGAYNDPGATDHAPYANGRFPQWFVEAPPGFSILVVESTRNAMGNIFICQGQAYEVPAINV